MKADKDVLKTLIAGLENALECLKNDMKYYIESIKETRAVEDVMHLKQQLLIDWLRNMPMGTDECYFCILYDDECERCIYAEHHGICATSSKTDLYTELVKLIDKYSDSMDDWSIIDTFKDALIIAIQKKYYKGEEYGNDKD